MEEKLNIFKKLLLFLQSYSKTRFGSGVIGFLIAASVSYFIWDKFIREEIAFRLEEKKLLDKKLSDCLEEKAEIREEVRREVTQEQREAMQFTYEYIQKLQQDISRSNIKKSKEVEQLEREIQRRKETTQ